MQLSVDVLGYKLEMYEAIKISMFAAPKCVFGFTLSIEEPMSLGTDGDREERPALVPSLFPLMPPTLYFSTADEKGINSAANDIGQVYCVKSLICKVHSYFYSCSLKCWTAFYNLKWPWIIWTILKITY